MLNNIECCAFSYKQKVLDKYLGGVAVLAGPVIFIRCKLQYSAPRH
jgi:hypothetical protein